MSLSSTAATVVAAMAAKETEDKIQCMTFHEKAILSSLSLDQLTQEQPPTETAMVPISLTAKTSW